MAMSMITTTTWVPRGYAAQFPMVYEFDEEEYDRIADMARLHLEDANEDLEDARKSEANSHTNGHSNGSTENHGSGDIPRQGVNSKEETDDDLKEYDLEHYDDPPVPGEDDEGGQDTMGIFGNIKSLVYHGSNEEDPYITLKEGDNDADSDREELQILATDNLLLAARVENEVSHLEVYVYEDKEDNLYVHHDIMLPAIPLCAEWLDVPIGKRGPNPEDVGRGSSVAIGTMDPDIEIWNLDVVDSMYPDAVLGKGIQRNAAYDRPKKRNRLRKPCDDYHVDAVLSLAANKQHRNLLASSSADATVKLWDLNTARCAKSYSYHTDKVCSIAWHSQESTALLSGSYDKTVIAADMRASGEANQRRQWRVDSDVEKVLWDAHDANYFYVSTESGLLYYFDARKTDAAASTPSAQVSSPVWRLQAHDGALSTFDINRLIPGYLVTGGSGDKTVKLWNIRSVESAPEDSGARATSFEPRLVVSRDMGVGRVFSTSFAPDAEVSFRLAIAGSQGSVQVWDTSTNPAIRNAFARDVRASGSHHAAELNVPSTAGAETSNAGRERITRPQMDNDGDDSDSDLSELDAAHDGSGMGQDQDGEE